MNLSEWHQVLATEPATPNQVGRIRAEFGRLGITGRAERLAITAALLDLDDLGSTRDLTMGEAGRLCGLLPLVGDRAELDAAIRAGQIEPPEPVAFVQAIMAALVQLCTHRQDAARMAERRRAGVL